MSIKESTRTSAIGISHLLFSLFGVIMVFGLLGFAVGQGRERGLAEGLNREDTGGSGTRVVVGDDSTVGEADGKEAADQGASAIPPESYWGIDELVAFGENTPGQAFHLFPEKLLELRKHINPEEIPSLLQQLDNQSPLRNLLFSLLADHDPYMMWEMSISGDIAFQESSLMRSFAIRAISQEDPDGALQMIRELDDPEIRNQALQVAIHFLSHQQPERALQLALEQFEAGEWANHNISHLLDNIAYRDSGVAQLLVERLKDPQLQENSIVSIARVMALEDVDAALKWVDRWDSEDLKNQVLQGMIHEIEPQKAAELLSQLKDDSMLESAIVSLARNWASKDVAEARNWIDTLPGDQKESAIAGLAQHIALTNPEKAMEMMLEMDSPNERGYLQSVVHEWIRRDRVAALQYLEKNEDRIESSQIYSSILYQWSRTQPREAAAYALQLDDQNVLRNASHTIISNWAKVNPQEAFAWVQKLPDEDLVKSAQESVFTEMANYNTNGAAAWIESMEPGETRDNAVQGLAWGIQETDPEGAIAWLQTLSKPGRHVESVVEKWLSNYPDEARGWISRSNLPEETKKRLLDSDS